MGWRKRRTNDQVLIPSSYTLRREKHKRVSINSPNRIRIIRRGLWLDVESHHAVRFILQYYSTMLSDVFDWITWRSDSIPRCKHKRTHDEKIIEEQGRCCNVARPFLDRCLARGFSSLVPGIEGIFQSQSCCSARHAANCYSSPGLAV